MRVLLIIFLLVISSVLPIQAGPVSFSLEAGGYNDVPQPRLRYPIYDSVILNKDQPLEFQWWNDVTQTSGFIFKIYKGYNMYAANLIQKNELPADTASIKIDSSVFVDGQVYTWSLIRVSFSGYKSDKSFNSFKVIKK
ncbi:MAG: hypothetical protein WC543_05160 [Candidatus Omnitrophota bacterium]